MTNQDEILISLKPKHAARIFDGEKTVELRKRRPKVRSGTRVWIYVTTPIAALIGYAALVRIETGSPVHIWTTLGGQTGISKVEFDLYFKACEVAHALVLDDAMELRQAIPLKRIRELVNGFQPPQFYCYLNGAREALRLSSRKYQRIKNQASGDFASIIRNSSLR